MICCQCGDEVKADFLVDAKLVPESAAWCHSCKVKVADQIHHGFLRTMLAYRYRTTSTLISIPILPASPQEKYRINYDRIFGKEKDDE